VSAKVIRLAVNILYATAVMHDAGPFRAVAQRESMAQFVNGFFAEAAVHRRIGNRGIKALLKAIGGYDGGLAPQLGFAVNVSENRYEQVGLGDGDDLQCVIRRHSGELLKNHG